ncbi:MAG: transposase family protein [Flavobacteriales bacterium]|nr:transposase family protein [Flavobacteriales bacterium]
MNIYKSYHSAVKTSFALGIQNQVLPTTFIKSIPRSTTQNWKEISAEKFVGGEFATQIETDLDKVKTLLDERVKKLTTAFYSFCRLYISILEFIGKKNFEKIILQNKESVIDLVNNLPVEFDRHMVCKFLQITPHQFKIWNNNRLYRCIFTAIGYCRKRFPNQISQKEINVLKSLMSRKRFQTWSTASIWGYAVKKCHVSMSRTSWYRYCLGLGISEKRKPENKPRKKDSVKATRPNQIWHIDVTEFVTADNVKFYVHTVLDNFSRKILAYTISRDKTARTRLISLKEAIFSQFKTQLSNQDLDIIADGGPENDNFRVRNLIRNSKSLVNIQLKIAKRDVTYSNSMIEGNFKILKQFLRKRGEIFSYTFHKEIDFFVRDYNAIRPHYEHSTYTPDEVHQNPECLNVKPLLDRINKERQESNRKSCCKVL